MNLLLGRSFDARVETRELEESIRELRENLKVQQKTRCTTPLLESVQRVCIRC